MQYRYFVVAVNFFPPTFRWNIDRRWEKGENSGENNNNIHIIIAKRTRLLPKVQLNPHEIGVLTNFFSQNKWAKTCGFGALNSGSCLMFGLALYRFGSEHKIVVAVVVVVVWLRMFLFVVCLLFNKLCQINSKKKGQHTHTNTNNQANERSPQKTVKNFRLFWRVSFLLCRFTSQPGKGERERARGVNEWKREWVSKISPPQNILRQTNNRSKRTKVLNLDGSNWAELRHNIVCKSFNGYKHGQFRMLCPISFITDYNKWGIHLVKFLPENHLRGDGNDSQTGKIFKVAECQLE